MRVSHGPRIAISQLHLVPTSPEKLRKKYRDLVEKAAREGADILVLPEYAGLEWAPPRITGAVAQFAALQDVLSDYLAFWQEMSDTHDLCIQPGTIPVAAKESQYFNRAWLFRPQQPVAYQDKLNLTAYEQQSRLIVKGDTLSVFSTLYGTVGIAICYDVEFPDLVRRLAIAGAKWILVPSCTDSRAGFFRVHLSCRVRALENQVYIANACLVGAAPWNDFIDASHGSGGVFAPMDIGFPEDGVLIQGEWDQETLLVSSPLPERKLEQVRNKGAVRNFTDNQNFSHQVAKLTVRSISWQDKRAPT